VPLPGIPGPQIPGDRCAADSGFLLELAQRCRPRILAGLDAAFDELQTTGGMLEREDLPHGGIAEQDRAGLVGKTRVDQSVIRRQISNLRANVMPACAGLVEGKHS
jgi:hypothetical protein